MNHKAKVRMARKMQTRLEQSKYRPDGVYGGIFLSKAWEARKKAIAKRESARQYELTHPLTGYYKLGV